MDASLYVERETQSSVIPGDEVMVIARNKGSEGAPPRFFVVALESGSTFEVRIGQGPDVSRFTNVIAGSGELSRGQRESIDLASAVAIDHNIYALRCLTGRLGVTIVSPHPVQTQFRTLGRSSA